MHCCVYNNKNNLYSNDSKYVLRRNVSELNYTELIKNNLSFQEISQKEIHAESNFLENVIAFLFRIFQKGIIKKVRTKHSFAIADVYE